VKPRRCDSIDGAGREKEKIVMNLPTRALALALLTATPLGLSGSASAMPLGGSPELQNAGGAVVETVQWRGGRGWGGWGWGPGLAAGAIIGGAVAAAQPWYGYDYGPGYSYDYDPGYASYGYAPGYSSYGYDPGYAPENASAYCAQRFRSYDPASGTYLGYDGLRHPCP
jgi:hypothetical protein